MNNLVERRQYNVELNERVAKLETTILNFIDQFHEFRDEFKTREERIEQRLSHLERYNEKNTNIIVGMGIVLSFIGAIGATAIHYADAIKKLLH